MRYMRILALAAATAVLLLVLEFLPAPDDSLFWSAVFNTGHAPLFGLFAMVCLGLASLLTGWTGGKRWWLYLIALVAAVFAGTITELIQFFGRRDADVMDALTNLAGSLSFLMFYSTMDRKLEITPDGGRRSMVAARRAIAVLLLVVVLAPVIFSIAAYMVRNDNFPILSDYETYLGSLFLDSSGASVDYTPLPERWESDGPGLVAHITFYRWDYPRLTIHEVSPDWSGHGHLAFTVYSDMEGPVRLVLLVEDSSLHLTREYQFKRVLQVSPGVNRVTVPVSDMEGGPEGKGLDVTDIRKVHLFATRPEKRFSLYVSAFRLE